MIYFRGFNEFNNELRQQMNNEMDRLCKHCQNIGNNDFKFLSLIKSYYLILYYSMEK